MTLSERISLLNLSRPEKRRRRQGPSLPPLVLITDATRLADPLNPAQQLPKGAAVLLRHYNDPGRKALAFQLAALCRRKGLIFIVAAADAAGVRLGLACRADGFHLPRGSWGGHAPSLCRLFGKIPRKDNRRLLITAAAHSNRALGRAASLGADAVFLSPVFATQSHPGRQPLGSVRFSAMVRRSRLPVYALGGITSSSLRRLSGIKIAGIGAIGGLAFTAATD
ncbi:MAG: thiamine phosphate synthase [Rhodospirillaceae bacterium]|nr:thiamine phosphate synthase [Rhodospirillaceae bacterium]